MENFEEILRKDLHQFLLSMKEVDERLPECPDVEEKWEEIAIAVLLLGSFHQKGKINVSRRLLIILAVVAIALSVLVTGIAAMMDFTELTKSTNLLITAAFSAMGLSFHRMKK